MKFIVTSAVETPSSQIVPPPETVAVGKGLIVMLYVAEAAGQAPDAVMLLVTS